MKDIFSHIKIIAVGIFVMIFLRVIEVCLLFLFFNRIPESTYLNLPFFPGIPVYRLLTTTVFLFSYSVPFLGALACGLHAKRQGWQYGLALGLILIILSIIPIIIARLFPVYFFTSRFPDDTINELLLRQLFSIIRHSPITLISTIIGGYLGERLGYEKNKTK